ncbi:hypothetical protein FRB94_006247 [Tulasnella sp. JGI-2019a]|nr:hypothetical protein FRB94_006247 [Tulasnella sp. JGI-2019a]
MSREREGKIGDAVQNRRGSERGLDDNTLGVDSADEITEERRYEDLDARMRTELHGIMAQRDNLTRPLYRLPPEILVEILSIALPDVISSPRAYIQRLLMFAFVSHQWRLYVNGTQSFWKVASSDMPLGLLRRVLSRSTGPLDVFAYKNSPTNVFIDHVVEHVHRWRSLTVSRTGRDEWFKHLAHLSMPMMEALDLRGWAFTEIDIGKVGSLRSIKLVKFYIPWKSKILPGLRTLKLESLGVSGPSTVQRLAIIAASPGLVELGLVRLGHGSSDTSFQTMRIELLMLETLKIMLIPEYLTRSLLASLHIPKCTSFTIDSYRTTAADLSLFNDPMLTHITSSLVASLRSSSGMLKIHQLSYQLGRIRFGSDFELATNSNGIPTYQRVY